LLEPLPATLRRPSSWFCIAPRPNKPFASNSFRQDRSGGRRSS
jgi:hypothetical protein